MSPTPPQAFISKKKSIILTYKTFIGLLSSLGPYFWSFIYWAQAFKLSVLLFLTYAGPDSSLHNIFYFVVFSS